MLTSSGFTRLGRPVSVALLAFAAGCGSTAQVSPGAVSVGPSGLAVAPAGSAAAPSPGAGDAGLSVAAAGTSGTASGPATGTGQGAYAGPGASSPAGGGVAGGSAAAVHVPIELGVLTEGSTTDAESQVGVSGGNTLTQRTLDDGMVNYYNQHGGIAGRRIVKVEDVVEASASNTYESQMQAACATFTQDHHVAAVVSAIGYSYDNLQTCLNKAGVPFIDSVAATDTDGYRSYPLFVTPADPSIDRRVAAMIEGRVKDGFLTPNNKLGVFLDDCPNNIRAYTRTLAPLAARYDITLSRYDINCVTGLADAGPAAAAMTNAILRWSGEGVDRVMFLSQFEATALALFVPQADNAHYQPEYLLSSLSAPAAIASNFSASDLAHMHGVGWLPDGDISQRITTGDARHRCRAAFADVGINPQTKSDDLMLDNTCESYFLLERLLHTTNGAMNGTVFLTALNRLGTVSDSPSDLGRFSFAANKHDGPDSFAPFDYVARCSCFRYTSAAS